MLQCGGLKLGSKSAEDKVRNTMASPHIRSRIPQRSEEQGHAGGRRARDDKKTFTVVDCGFCVDLRFARRRFVSR